MIIFIIKKVVSMLELKLDKNIKGEVYVLNKEDEIQMIMKKIQIQILHKIIF